MPRRRAPLAGMCAKGLVWPPSVPPVWDMTKMIGMEATQSVDSPGGTALATVREIMSTKLITIEPSANLTEAVHAMSAGRSGSVLVLTSGFLVGIFTERDILRALAHSANADLARVSSVAQWMSRDPVTIGPDTTVGEALNQMLFGGSGICRSWMETPLWGWSRCETSPKHRQGMRADLGLRSPRRPRRASGVGG
jgi:CBS domain